MEELGAQDYGPGGAYCQKQGLVNAPLAFLRKLLQRVRPLYSPDPDLENVRRKLLELERRVYLSGEEKKWK